MARQISTSISDGALAFFTFVAALQALQTSIMAAVGFLVLVAAASCGTIRFAHEEAPADLVAWHQFLSWLVPVLGLPSIASAYSVQANVTYISHAMIAGGVAVIILQKFLSRDLVTTLGDVIGGCCIVHILLLSLRQLNMCGLVGAGLYVVASLVVKTDGVLWGFLRVDLFHYALVLANLSLQLGLTQEDKPLYYNSRST